MYQLIYHPSVWKKLKRIHPKDKKRMITRLELFAKNPHDAQIDIKKLITTVQSYRIRSGNVRAIFEIDEEAKKIYVWEIDYRGNVY